MRRLRLALSLLCLALGVWTPTVAHRLDEYLQAATITLARDHVAIELRLTPGIRVADTLLSDIDTNNDGAFSSAEQRRYAVKVQQDLRLLIDGQPTSLRLIGFGYPPPRSIRDGVGDIDLTFDAPLQARPTSHALTFENHHLHAIAVYLVNTLLPADTGIQVTSQDRAIDQSSYRLGFTTAAPAAVSAPTGASADRPTSNEWPILATFFIHGIRHILTGYDHLLFVAALVLGAASLWDLVKVVTAFTVAQTVTLTLTVFGWVHLSPQFVEPVISASIVFVAVQDLVRSRQSHGVSRLVVAFLFGLFHGLGFAGGLMDLMHAMPRNALVVALVGFSLGVEAGNQLVLLPLYGFLTGARGLSTRLNHPGAFDGIRQGGAGLIAAGGFYFLGLALVAPG